VKADQRIEANRYTLFPGLADTHVHYSADRGLAYLAAGVTTVRDMGNQNERLLRAREMINRGELPGPHIVPSGFIEGASRFASRNGVIAPDLDRALEAVNWYAARGYRSIKLYSSVRPEWVEPIARAARQRGLRISGHIPAFMGVEQAIRLGFDEIVHANQLMLHFVARPGDDTRTMQRFTRVGEDGRGINLAGPRARSLIDLMKARKTSFEPTLVAFEAMFNQKQGQSNPSYIAVADHLPVLWRRELKVAELDLEGDRLDQYRESFQRMLELTAAIHREGLPILVGSDSTAGLGVARELELLVRAGIPAAEALQLATWGAARALGEDTQRGTIERGRRAELILIEGDPTVRIEDIRRVALVIQGTTAYRPSELWQQMGFRSFAAPASIDGADAED